MSPKMTQGGRDKTSRGRTVEKSVSTPTLNLSSGNKLTFKVLGKQSAGDLIDKHSPGRGTSEGPRSILKRSRRVTLATQNPAQGKPSSSSSEKQPKGKSPNPRKSLSPDLLDLTDEDVVKDVLIRLYDSLGIADETNAQDEESGRWAHIRNRARLYNVNSTARSALYKPATDSMVDATPRRRSMSFPQLRCPNMSCEVFYTSPTSSQTVRPLSRQTPRPHAFSPSPVMKNTREGRTKAFTNLFPTLCCNSPSGTKTSVCSVAHTRGAGENTAIVKQEKTTASTRSPLPQKSRAQRYSVTFA